MKHLLEHRVILVQTDVFRIISEATFKKKINLSSWAGLVQAFDPSTQEQRLEDSEFEACLVYKCQDSQDYTEKLKQRTGKLNSHIERPVCAVHLHSGGRSYQWVTQGRSIGKLLGFFFPMYAKRTIVHLMVTEVCVLVLRNIYYVFWEEDHVLKILYPQSQSDGKMLCLTDRHMAIHHTLFFYVCISS